MAWTAPRTWTTGETVTSTIMNTHVRDNQLALTTWADFTPSWTSSGTAPAIGNGTLTGRYITAGDLVHFRIEWQAGSTTTFGTGNYSLSLPVTAAALKDVFNVVARDDDAGDFYTGTSLPATTTTFQVVLHRGAAAGDDERWTPSAPITWATSDWLYVAGTYEAA